MSKPKIYIANLSKDENYKKNLLSFNNKNDVFIDVKRHKGIYDIKTSLKDRDILHQVQKLFVSNIDIIILLVGEHPISKSEYLYDWELAASFNNDDNKKRGIIIVLLPEAKGFERVHSLETKNVVIKDFNITDDADTKWNKLSFIYPTMPSRVIDNIVIQNNKIDIIKWDTLISSTSDDVTKLLEAALDYKDENSYKTTRPLFPKSMLK